MMTEARLRELLAERFGGLLRGGSHRPDGEVCAIELRAAALGLPWTDDPRRTRDFDYRAINDIVVPDALRTEWMLPVILAYAGSLDWPRAAQQRVVDRLVIWTVQRVIAALPHLPPSIRDQCREARTVEAAEAAARAAAWASEAAGEAAAAAWAAVEAAAAAAWAAAAAAWAAGEAAAAAAWAAAAAAWAAGEAAAAAGEAAEAEAWEAAEAEAWAAGFVQACHVWIESAESRHG